MGTNSWHCRGFKKLAICTERRTRVIEAFIALANAIIIIRRLIRTAWTTHRWTNSRDPAVLAYRTDEEMWAARPEIMPYPAGWWRMVIARAVSEVPGVVIDYAARRDLREN